MTKLCSCFKTFGLGDILTVLCASFHGVNRPNMYGACMSHGRFRGIAPWMHRFLVCRHTFPVYCNRKGQIFWGPIQDLGGWWWEGSLLVLESQRWESCIKIWTMEPALNLPNPVGQSSGLLWEEPQHDQEWRFSVAFWKLTAAHRRLPRFCNDKGETSSPRWHRCQTRIHR